MPETYPGHIFIPDFDRICVMKTLVGGNTEHLVVIDKSFVPRLQPLVQARLLSQFVKNWKAASSEEKKRMWSIFDESGVFVSAC